MTALVAPVAILPKRAPHCGVVVDDLVFFVSRADDRFLLALDNFSQPRVLGVSFRLSEQQRFGRRFQMLLSTVLGQN